LIRGSGAEKGFKAESQLRRSWRCANRTIQKRCATLLPSSVEPEPENDFPGVTAQHRTENEQLHAHGSERDRGLTENLSFELGYQVEKHADQAEHGFGRVERVHTEAIGTEVVLELFDGVLAGTALVIEIRALRGRYFERSHQSAELVADRVEQSPLLVDGTTNQQQPSFLSPVRPTMTDVGDFMLIVEPSPHFLRSTRGQSLDRWMHPHSDEVGDLLRFQSSQKLLGVKA